MIGNIALRQKEAPSKALLDLDERIHALEELRVEEEDSVVAPEAYYSERDLAAFYSDVLANPFEREAELEVDLQAMRSARAAEDASLVQSIYERFDVEGTSSTSSSTEQASQRPVQVILSRLNSIVSRLEAAERLTGSGHVTEEQQMFPVSILTMRECEALVNVAARAKDAQSAELTLQLMQRTGLPIPEEAVTSVLRLYGRTGNPVAADRFMETFSIGQPNEDQRHFHIQAHMKSTPDNLIPLSALELIHSYENQNMPPPMGTYTSMISALFHRPSSIARAQAWDLFSHMRYVAHPDPNVPLYTLMIKACAFPLKSSLQSEPEKALDLWTEMTVDHGLIPTVASYNAVILACARAGTQEFVGEAFKIARQMLDSHRDAHGQSAYRPDRKTFCALLEGAKRLGDLSRVRWILAEMTRSQEGLESLNAPVNAEVDEEVMMHVFNAYAAYTPPFVRSKTAVVESNAPKGQLSGQSTSSSLGETGSQTASTSTAIEPQTPATFAHVPPQTQHEVLAEVDFLFQSIREAQDAGLSSGKFGNVRITPRLLTAYLSVHYNHSSLRASRDLFRTIFDDCGIGRPVRAYIEALERCANAKKSRHGGQDRQVALEFAEEIQKDWMAIESAGVHPDSPKPLEARSIERAAAAIIRVYTLNGKIDKALDYVRAFASRYPPNSVRAHTPKPLLRSTKTILGVGDTSIARPLVRMTGATEVGDDYVPPMLLFKDLETLHHQLVAYGRTKDIGYLKWLGKAYEWALRVRRDESNRHVPKAGTRLQPSSVASPSAAVSSDA